MKNIATKNERDLNARPRRAADAIVERKPDGAASVKIRVRAPWPFSQSAGTMKTFELDEIGVLVWDSCDGRTTVAGVIATVAKKYCLNLREAEVATLKFLQTLANKRLIGLAGEE
jgi:Coenzyme PQQ synthesis protein D (PqqD)